MEHSENVSQSYANEAFVQEPGCNNSTNNTTVEFDEASPVQLISVRPIVEDAMIAVPTNDRSYDDDQASDEASPVQLISVRPIVEDAMIAVPTNDRSYDEDQASKRNLSKYNWKHFIPITRRDASNPAIDNAGCFSLMFLNWATPVIKKGFKRSLQLEDFDEISPYESAEVNFQRGMRMWDKEVERKGLKNSSMRVVLWKAVRTRIIFGIAFFVLSQIIAFFAPAVFIRLILEYIEKKDETSQLQGIGWVIGLFLSEVTRMAFFSLSFFTNTRTGARMRAMVLTMVYKKVSKLRNVGDKSIGEFVNLCASDADRIYQAILFNSFIFSGPIVIVLTVIYTTMYIGPSALLGCGLFILFYPIQAVIGKIAVRFRSKVVFITDRRVRMMYEILTSIKLIKMYAWEKSFARAISAIRRLERRALTKSSFLQGINMSLALVIPTVATVLTFFVHVASGKDLSSSQAYTVLAIFNLLVFSLVVLPFGVRALAEANIAVKRLQSLMVMEEIQHFVQKSDDPRVSLSLSGATFAWDKVELNNKDGAGNESESPLAGAKLKDDAVELLRNSSQRGNAGRGGQGRSEGGLPGRARAPLEVKTTLEPALFDVDLTVDKNTLVGICGSVGSGKSSLLQSLLGQMRMQKGRVAIGGSTAYVAQQAWIMNATLRDNILFGKPYDKVRYKSVCFACGLEHDLSMLPNGDMTEIGERGINLSGGQKQRISLARALFADKDIYLLDDPLSAVDAHVGQHIFKHCIKGALRNKTILLATHQLQYLSQCDVVLYMKQGKIAERGSYDELICNNGEFASLIRRFIREVEEDAEETEDLGTVPELQRLDSSSSSVSADDIRRLFEERLSSTRSATQKPNNMRGSWNEPSLVPFKHNFASKRSRESARRAFESANADADDKRKEEAGKLVHKEDRVEGAVTFATYKNYMKSGGGYCVFLFLMLFIVACLGGQLFIDTWLGVWLNAAAAENLTTPEKSGIVAGNPSNNFYVLVYLVSVVAFFLAVLLKGYLFVVVTLKASSNLHDHVFSQVSKATMAFFDTTPIGRILNRFSKDLDEIDVQLPFNLETSLQSVIRILISIGIIAVVIPWFLVGLAPLVAIFALINVVFNRSVRQLKRIDGVTRSPIYSHLTATVQGLATLHAYDKMDDFNEIFKGHVDNNTRPFFMFFASSRWLAVRLDMLTIVLVTLSAALVVLVKGTLPSVFLGLALTYALKLTNLLQFTVRQIAETEARFTSVERIAYYIRSVPCEAEAKIPDKKPPATWPDGGAITLSGIKMRYRDGLPIVLDNINCEIRRCEKVGIVGRTGSGKSSLGVLLWRLVEPEEGTMYIDNVDIRQLGLEDLRSRMSIIPQDPVLFVGTVRYNLDPFGEHSDSELWAALEKAHLREMVDSLPSQLMAPVTENGDNFSVGERQLICMARALLRHSKILLLDEATAAIDSETDAKIQDTIRLSFKDCTLLTIAHRLNTVMDSDRVMVMHKGKIVEFDSPTALLANPESAFSKLVQATEVQAEDRYLIQ